MLPTVSLGKSRCEDGDGNAQLHFVLSTGIQYWWSSKNSNKERLNFSWLGEPGTAQSIRPATADNLLYTSLGPILGILPEAISNGSLANRRGIVMPRKLCRRGG